MLINFSFSNFKSYRDEQRFSMQRPSNAQRHEEGDWERMGISTVAGIYGGNASGKSAFIDAFRFVCDYVTNGFDPNYDLSDRLRPFMLDAVSRERPSEFLVDIIRNIQEAVIGAFSVVARSCRHRFSGSSRLRALREFDIICDHVGRVNRLTFLIGVFACLFAWNV